MNGGIPLSAIPLKPTFLQSIATLLLRLIASFPELVSVHHSHDFTAGGATRAALTHHQATRGNTADVAAKDGSQETLVNLAAMSLGIWLINTSPVQKYVLLSFNSVFLLGWVFIK